MAELPLPLAAALVCINIVAFALMGIDKLRAWRGAWRISERTLLGVCALFGALGGYAGMQIFRHKTKHRKFSLGLPAMLVVQLALLARLTGAF